MTAPLLRVFTSKHKKSFENPKLVPKTATYAFEAIDPEGKPFGVIFEYEGVTETNANNEFFYAPFKPVRQVESTEPITFLGEQLGLTICWKNHDRASRVFLEENAFLKELKLVGRALFLETSVSKVTAKVEQGKK